MTGAEIEDMLARHRAALNMLNMLVGELLAELPTEKRETLQRGLHTLGEMLHASGAAALPEQAEMAFSHGREAARSILDACQGRPLTNIANPPPGGLQLQVDRK